jgi:hypothetical protein
VKKSLKLMGIGKIEEFKLSKTQTHAYDISKNAN